SISPTAFSLLVYTGQLRLTRLFLKKRRTSPLLPVQSRSENALELPPRSMGGGNQRAQPAQQDEALDVNRSLVQVVENLAAGIIGGHRVHVAANGFPRGIHARDD